MKRIVVYISDHGYGHAARMIGLIRRLNIDNEIIVKNSNAYSFLKKSLPKVKVINFQTDVGPITNTLSKNSDSDKTFKLFSKWINNEKKWITNEIDYFKNKKIDLVVSDISPMGIKFAKKMRIPSLTIANFSWIDILEKLPNNKNKESILNWLNDSFETTNLTIKLPLHMKLKGLKRIRNSSLICRNVTTNKKQVLKKLNLNYKPITIYLGNESLSKINIVTNEPKTKFVYMRKNDIKIDGRIIKYQEAQNIINTSNLVIAKPGYGVISECINYRCPILLIPNNNYPEHEVLCIQSKKLGIATILDVNLENNTIVVPQFFPHDLKNKIQENQIKKIEKLPKASALIKEFLTR